MRGLRGKTGTLEVSVFACVLCGLVTSLKWLSSGGVTCLLVGFVWSQSIKAANHRQKIKNNAPMLSFLYLKQGKVLNPQALD